jgi:hypothetical protein
MSEQNDFPTTQAEYAAARDELLARIGAGLQADSRFAAAWLAGSMGRGEADQVSDIDLFVVVEDLFAGDLCYRPQVKNAGSLPERLALFTAFGEPANLHENHANAPEGGSFSAVLYARPPVMVDWTLVPLSLARRPTDTSLLFERTPIPLDFIAVEELLPPEELAARLAERAAFFWMMAAVVAKYLARGAADAAHQVLPLLSGAAADLEQLLDREPRPDEAGNLRTVVEQKTHLLALCERVESLGLPAVPRAQVEAIMNLQ